MGRPRRKIRSSSVPFGNTLRAGTKPAVRFSQRELNRMVLSSLSAGSPAIMVEPNEGWRAVMRNDGLRRYPTPSYLQQFLLANYVTEKIGPSVPQRGDPIPRFAFDCTPRRPIALFISGAQNSGKTTLANILRSRSILTYSIDSLFLRLVSVEAYFRSDLSKSAPRTAWGEKKLACGSRCHRQGWA